MSNQSKILAFGATREVKARDLVQNNRHTIRLHGDGHILENISVEGAYDGERDKKGTLLAPGGVEFRTEKGKKLFLKYTEFSFLFNHVTARAA